MRGELKKNIKGIVKGMMFKKRTKQMVIIFIRS